jgi:hypothetical protein
MPAANQVATARLRRPTNGRAPALIRGSPAPLPCWRRLLCPDNWEQSVMVPTGAGKLTRAPAEKARAQPFSTAPWITGRARGGEMGGRLFPQRARRPFVPNKGDEARQLPRGCERIVWVRRIAQFKTRKLLRRSSPRTPSMKAHLVDRDLDPPRETVPRASSIQHSPVR